MVQFAPVRLPPSFEAPPTSALPFEFALLQHAGIARQRTKTLFASLAFHAVLVVLVVLVPILTYDILPAPGEGTRAFFVAPPDVAPPPPPPPPPPAGVRAAAKTPAVPAPSPPSDAKFVAPFEIPDAIRPAESLDIAGVPGGVPGGVEGGVPGGVLGGVVGGLPTPTPPPVPVRVVRVGGQLKAPALVHRVEPVYPELAIQARLSAIVIVEAWVDSQGRVKSVTVLRGAPLFDEPAVAAVKQWRYQPLLLNGVPTEFLLTATVKFHILAPTGPRS
jgi:protein TonB